MKIEIGKTYSVTPSWKKSVVETEHWTGDDGQIDVTVVWRGGEFYVTPQNDEEVALLEKAMTEEEGIELHVNGFEEWELRETYDGCSEDMDFDVDWDEEKIDAFQEEYWDDRWGTMEKYGFDNNDCDTYIYCRIDVEEVEAE